MNEQEDEGTGAVEALSPSEAARLTVDRLEVFLHTIEGMGVTEDGAKAELARWFDRFARQAVEARVARIVAALNAQKQTAAIGEERANQQNRIADGARWNTAKGAFDEAIAIAREEG